MQSRIFINIILLILVIILAVVMFNNEPATDETETVLVSNIDEQSINRIEIQRSDKKTITFEKNSMDWQMTEPYLAPAHPTRIQAMLSLLTTNSSNQLTVDNVALDQLGLQTPEVSLQLNDDVFEFGSTNPLDQTRYLRHKDTIYTISDQLFHQLNTNESFFIYPKLILQPEHVTSIKTPEYTLVKHSEQWVLDPAPENVETTANVLLNAWQQLEGNQVKPIEEQEIDASIIISQADDTKIILDIVSYEPELILANRSLNLQYHISQFMAEMIFPKPATEE